MFKNTASQKIYYFAFDSATNLPKTGDASHISGYIAKDFGSVTQLTDTSATEVDATNAPGLYVFDITQTETNADVILASGKSSTSGIVVMGAPATIFTLPPNFGAFALSSQGRVDIGKVAGGDVNGVGSVGSNPFTGNITKDGSNYRLLVWLVVNGTTIPGASLSNAVVVFYDKEGDTDLSWTGTPAIASTGAISGSGTMTDPGTNKPFGALVSVDYAGATYTGFVPVSVPA